MIIYYLAIIGWSIIIAIVIFYSMIVGSGRSVAHCNEVEQSHKKSKRKGE